MGLLDRETGQVHVKHVANTQRDTLHSEVRERVESGAEIFTDEWIGLSRLESGLCTQRRQSR